MRPDHGPAQPPATTVPAAFTAAAGRDPGHPLLTWYDDATGERVELSGATLANWVAKTANLLLDAGLGPGDVAVVDAPPHWQTAAVLLGCWSAGLRVAVPGEAADVVFAAAGRAAGHAGRGAEVFGLPLAPLAAPLRDPPPGVADYVIEVRAHGDDFTPYAPVGPEMPATDLTHGELCAAAAERAAQLDIAGTAATAPAQSTPGGATPDFGARGRVLVDTAAHPDPLDWLLAPLVAGASVVLCGNLDPAKLPDRAAVERVTAVLTADAG
jgi:uncharacterized protein (TIGR03089 family)